MAKKAEVKRSIKPRCVFSGADGNIFNLISIATRSLRDFGRGEDADIMYDRIHKTAASYDEAIAIIGEYVEIV